MTTLVTCNTVGTALTGWLAAATDEQKLALCNALGCSSNSGDITAALVSCAGTSLTSGDAVVLCSELDALVAAYIATHPVVSTDSTTVDFSGSGTSASPLTAKVKLSSASDNTLVASASGLYVAPSTDTYGLEANDSYGAQVGMVRANVSSAVRSANAGSVAAGSIAIGSAADSNSVNGIAIGFSSSSSSNSNSSGSIAIGHTSYSSSGAGTGASVAVGDASRSEESAGTAVGARSTNTGNYGVAIGYNSTNTASAGVAIGARSSVTDFDAFTKPGIRSTILGAFAANSAAGSGVGVVRAAEVSIAGYTAVNSQTLEYRRLWGVATPELGNDAVNKQYVDALKTTAGTWTAAQTFSAGAALGPSSEMLMSKTLLVPLGAVGEAVTYATSVSATKLRGVQVIVIGLDGAGYGPGTTEDTTHFTWKAVGSGIKLTVGANATMVAGKSCNITIFYVA